MYTGPCAPFCRGIRLPCSASKGATAQTQFHSPPARRTASPKDISLLAFVEASSGDCSRSNDRCVAICAEAFLIPVPREYLLEAVAKIFCAFFITEIFCSVV